VMCRDDGTVVDDLLVFVLAEDRILLIVNASNIDKDFAHVTSFGDGGVDVKNVSDEYALIAVQGPLTREVLHNCAVFGEVAKEIDETPYYRGFWFDHRGQRVTVSRTGYTGELGFEILVPNALAEGLWNDLMEAGAQQGIKPVGLGARDTLRFEASLCLYGHELDDATTPLEAGLGWLVKLKKDKFRGLDALRREKAEGSRRKLVGFELEGRNIARQGYEVMHGGKPVGKVTSGAFAPALQKSLCMALVASEVGDNEDCSVEVRNKSVPAAATALPFYPSRAR
jgi:aminomethyltransferase